MRRRRERERERERELGEEENGEAARIEESMSDASGDDEAICPLCTEEMDVTDKSINFCKCGYQLCLWCWHHLMETAAKDNAVGRCPNCRTPYDPERITMEKVDPKELEKTRRQAKAAAKPQSKPGSAASSKDTGGMSVAASRKHLHNVRVVQRNLVYAVGLPLHCCREEVLRRNEWFGRFGKIVKVSANRNGAYSTAQNGPTGSAYVTFHREDEAIRCISKMDGMSVDGKTIRACFGTTKYCNTFLRGLQCLNPDCLYLHDFGSAVDSFTKEEMLAKYGSKHQVFHSHQNQKPQHQNHNQQQQQHRHSPSLDGNGDGPSSTSSSSSPEACPAAGNGDRRGGTPRYSGDGAGINPSMFVAATSAHQTSHRASSYNGGLARSPNQHSGSTQQQQQQQQQQQHVAAQRNVHATLQQQAQQHVQPSKHSQTRVSTAGANLTHSVSPPAALHTLPASTATSDTRSVDDQAGAPLSARDALPPPPAPPPGQGPAMDMGAVYSAGGFDNGLSLDPGISVFKQGVQGMPGMGTENGGYGGGTWSPFQSPLHYHMSAPGMQPPPPPPPMPMPMPMPQHRMDASPPGLPVDTNSDASYSPPAFQTGDPIRANGDVAVSQAPPKPRQSRFAFAHDAHASTAASANGMPASPHAAPAPSFAPDAESFFRSFLPNVNVSFSLGPERFYGGSDAAGLPPGFGQPPPPPPPQHVLPPEHQQSYVAGFRPPISEVPGGDMSRAAAAAAPMNGIGGMSALTDQLMECSFVMNAKTGPETGSAHGMAPSGGSAGGFVQHPPGFRVTANDEQQSVIVPAGGDDGMHDVRPQQQQQQQGGGIRGAGKKGDRRQRRAAAAM